MTDLMSRKTQYHDDSILLQLLKFEVIALPRHLPFIAFNTYILEKDVCIFTLIKLAAQVTKKTKNILTCVSLLLLLPSLNETYTVADPPSATHSNTLSSP